jgi:hypothetical protein
MILDALIWRYSKPIVTGGEGYHCVPGRTRRHLPPPNAGELGMHHASQPEGREMTRDCKSLGSECRTSCRDVEMGC